MNEVLLTTAIECDYDQKLLVSLSCVWLQKNIIDDQVGFSGFCYAAEYL